MSLNLTDLALQNPWWRDPTAILDDPKVKEALSKKPPKTYTYPEDNILLLGPRQVGKTTFLKLYVRDLISRGVKPRCILYFSCETLKDADSLVDLVTTYDTISPPSCHKYLLLDEVTFVEGWEKAVKHILDTGLSRNKTFYITGSSSMWLLRGAERMPGRDISLKVLMPQTFRGYTLLFGSEKLREVLVGLKPVYLEEPHMLSTIYRQALSLLPHVSELSTLFRQYLSSGGFLKTAYALQEKGYMSEETYLVYVKWIEGDMARLGKRVSLLRPVLGALAEKMTTSVSYAVLARETGLGSHVTARDYLEALEGLLVIRTFYQVGPDRRSPAYRKEKKIYFTDPFLYSVARSYSHEIYRDYSIDAEDRLVEAATAEHVARQFRDHRPRVMYYRERGETDLVVLNRDAKLLGLEVKWRNNVDERDFPNRHRFREKILVSKKDLAFDESKGMLVAPAPLLLVQLATHPVYIR